MVGTKRIYAGKDTKTVKKTKVVRYPRYKNMLGDSTTCSLKYVEYITLDPGVAGIPSTYVFTANGLFDPNITAGGRQPRGFDQLKVLFDHYHVVSGSCKVTFMQGPSTVTSMIVGIQLNDDLSPSGDMIHEMENRNVTYAGLSATGDSKTLTQRFNSKSFFTLNDRQLYGNATSNPADQAFYILFAQPIQSIDANGCVAMVEITYNVKWSEPNNVSSS